MTKKQYKVGFFDEPTDVDDYVEYDGQYLTCSDVVELLNRQEETINELKKVSQDYEDIVANFFWENWLKFDEKLQEEIILLFDVDGDSV